MNKRESTLTDLAHASCSPEMPPGTDYPDRTVVSAELSAWRFAAPVAIIALVLLAYIPALDASFVNWDDYRLLFNETTYQNLNAEGLRWMFTTSYAGHFQPLTWLSYSLDYAVWGRSAFGFHLTNVVLHMAVAVTFYLVGRRLLAVGTGIDQAATSRPLILSASFAAVLFAVHPLRAESVAWVSERRDVLSGLFFVLAVGFYVWFATSAGRPACTGRVFGSPRRHRCYYAAALACCLLSLLAKATAMTLPLVLLVLDVYPLRRLGGAASAANRGGGRVWSEKIPFFLLAFAAGLRALLAQEEGGALYQLEEHGVPARFGQACYGLGFYLRKTLWPTDLGPLYEIPPREVLLGPMLWISVMSLLVVAGVAVWQRRRWPALAASLAAYAVILSPVLGFVQSGPQLVADRYSYLSCMGFALVGGAILLRCRRRESWWARRRPSYVLGLIVAVLVVALHRATFAQNDVWRDPLTLWTQGVRVSPDSAVANVNMADALVSFLLHGAAVPFYKRALELNPDDPVAHHHLADVYKYFGDAGAAIYHYRRALQIDPDRPRACYSLAELFNGTGRGDLAVIVLRDGAQRRPDALRLIDYLARLLASHPDAKVRNGEEALRWAEHAIRLSGADHVPSLMTMAVAEAELGRFDAAIETAERALTLAEAAEADLLIHRLTRRLAIFRQGRPYRMNQ